MQDQAPTLSPSPSRVQRVRHELKRRELEVLRVDRIAPHVASIVFHGESLADFVSASFDDHVKFMLEGAADAKPVGRDYTPRAFDRDARTLTIEFALHGDGPVANWASQARPGQRVLVGGPRGSMVVPLDFDWHLLVGDETALPAIARRLEELPAGARAIVIGQVGEDSDRRSFRSAAAFTVQWADSAAALIEAVRALTLPPGEGYAWCAGEAATMATVRRLLVDEKGHPRHAIRAAAYWKHGAAAHHANIED